MLPLVVSRQSAAVIVLVRTVCGLLCRRVASPALEAADEELVEFLIRCSRWFSSLLAMTCVLQLRSVLTARRRLSAPGRCGRLEMAVCGNDQGHWNPHALPRPRCRIRS